MSTTSPRDAAAADIAKTQAQLQGQMGNIAYPLMQAALKDTFSRFSTSESDINKIYDQAQSELAKGYANQAYTSKNLMIQQAKQGGAGVTQGQIGSALGQYGEAAGRQQYVDKQMLNSQRSQSQMQNYNALLSMLGQGTQAAYGISQGFVGNQMGAMNAMSGNSQMGNALGGLASGAGIGATVGGVPGAVVGGVAGLGLGLFGGG